MFYNLTFDYNPGKLCRVQDFVNKTIKNILNIYGKRVPFAHLKLQNALWSKVGPFFILVILLSSKWQPLFIQYSIAMCIGFLFRREQNLCFCQIPPHACRSPAASWCRPPWAERSLCYCASDVPPEPCQTLASPSIYLCQMKRQSRAYDLSYSGKNSELDMGDQN